MIPLLEIKNLSVDFITDNETTHAVKNISFHVSQNEIVALVGESGSGKSVTALSILRLLSCPPAKYVSGEILFTENNSATVSLLLQNQKQLQEIRGNKIAMIFQEPMTSLNPVLTCGSQVMEVLLQHKKISTSEAKQKTIEWFTKVKLPNPSAIFSRYPHQLSGGQKQRVMIAMAMCCEPSLLICDEPTTALDVTVQKTILMLIKELQQQTNMAVIFITHDLAVVAEIADRAVIMYKGEIAEQNSVQNIFHHAEHPYTKGLIACRPVLHQKGERLPVVSDFLETKSEIRSLKSEAGVLDSETTFPASGIRLQAPVLLQVQQLSVWFPSKKTFLGKILEYTKAVDDVSFEVYKGETVGLVGESGCGKTTLGRTLLRLIEPTSGKIFLNGKDLTATPAYQLKELRKDMQIIFQDPYSSLNPRITIGSAITEPMKVHGLFKNDKQRKDKAVSLLENVNLDSEYFNRYPHEFSGGQRQRIVIARALALNPSFIICDESVSALDVSVQAQVLNLLNDLKKEFNYTIVFISHDLSIVRYMSDRIMVMNKGKIEECGPAEDIWFNPQKEYTRQLIASIPKGLAV